MEQVPSPNTLAEAQAVIERQAAELGNLSRQLETNRAAEELRQAFSLATTISQIASPVTHGRLLEMIVGAAAQILSAKAAALFLIDEEKEELVFEVALGQKASEVKKFRVPLGHGIAGLVASTGQPMAVSNADKDARQATDIAQAVGYIPKNILCMPLFYNDRVIGVIELLDKELASSFTLEDMNILSLFANQAGVAIELSFNHRNLMASLLESLTSLGNSSDGPGKGLQSRTREYARQFNENETYKQAQELAYLVQKIAWEGRAELKLCKTVLQNFAAYMETKMIDY